MNALERPPHHTERNMPDAWLEAGWLLVAILMPLGVNLWARQPFDLPKAAILRSLVWVMAGLWLWYGRRARYSISCQLEGNPLLWPALTVAVVQLSATVLAVDRRLSLWGSYERSAGALTLVSYVLLFLIVSARMRTLGQARRLLMVIVATGLPLIGLGLVQAFGWDPVGLVSDARSPVYATLGRSNFLGAYLSMLLPLTLALTVTAQHRWQRLVGGMLALGEVAIVVLTLARGAWLAAGVALGIFAWFCLWPRLVSWQRKVAVVCGLIGLAILLAGALWLGSQPASATARLTIWQATWGLIADRPILGYGPDALRLVFPRVYPPELVYYQGRGLVVDRAHNLFLDWMVTTGVLGLIAELALLTTFFVMGWRAIKREIQAEKKILLVACQAAVAGNLIGNLVSFDVTATMTVTWLLMAVTVVIAAPGKRGDQDQGVPRPARTWPSWLMPSLALVMVVVVSASVVQANIRPLAADVAGRIADERSATGDWLGAIKAGEQAVALWPGEPAQRQALSWVYWQQAQASVGDPLPWLQKAEAELLAARDLRPGDFGIWAALGELYGLWGNHWDAKRLPDAHHAYRQATALAPHHAMLFTAWGMVNLESGDIAQAAAKFRQAVDLDATDGYAFAHLGDAELMLGRLDDALVAYQQAAHWQPDLSHARLGLARCYWGLGQEQAASLSLEQALTLDPANAAAWALRQRMDEKP